MAKRPPPGNCVHCLQHFQDLTWDHGIPDSWYPRGVTSEKIKAPSCRPCQERLAKVERAVLLPLALCLDPNDPLASGVPQAVWRSLDPTLAAKPGMTESEVERERRARTKLLEETRARLFQPTPEEYCCAVPGFGLADAKGNLTAIKCLHETELQTLGEKFARVALWVMRNHLLVPPECRVKAHILDPAKTNEFDAIIRRGEALDIFPGIRVNLQSAADSAFAHLLLFELWGRFKLYVSVVP